MGEAKRRRDLIGRDPPNIPGTTIPQGPVDLPAIQVRLTDEGTEECFEVTIAGQKHLLHATQVVDLQRKLAAAWCDWQIMCLAHLIPR
jgi:hypothetical protein